MSRMIPTRKCLQLSQDIGSSNFCLISDLPVLKIVKFVRHNGYSFVFVTTTIYFMGNGREEEKANKCRFFFSGFVLACQGKLGGFRMLSVSFEYNRYNTNIGHYVYVLCELFNELYVIHVSSDVHSK